MKELYEIQSAVNVPKNSYNSFGKYNYRSCETILESVKPILKAFKCSILLNDELVYIGNRYYIKATATIRNESGETDSVTAYAREAETKKNFDEAQITGGASSYARKYALCGLLAIDDNKDPDTEEYQRPEKTQKSEPAKPDTWVVETQEKTKELAPKLGTTADDVEKKLLEQVKGTDLKLLNNKQRNAVGRQLEIWADAVSEATQKEKQELFNKAYEAFGEENGNKIIVGLLKNNGITSTNGMLKATCKKVLAELDKMIKNKA